MMPAKRNITPLTPRQKQVRKWIFTGFLFLCVIGIAMNLYHESTNPNERVNELEETEAPVVAEDTASTDEEYKFWFELHFDRLYETVSQLQELETLYYVEGSAVSIEDFRNLIASIKGLELEANVMAPPANTKLQSIHSSYLDGIHLITTNEEVPTALEEDNKERLQVLYGLESEGIEQIMRARADYEKYLITLE